MPTIDCAQCATRLDEADAYFGEDGMVCPTCHADQESADSAAFRAGADDGVHPGGLDLGVPDGHLGNQTVERRVNADGSITTVTRTTSVDLGWLGVIVKLVMGLFRR